MFFLGCRLSNVASMAIEMNDADVDLVLIAT
jgi:hypothetical protein